MKKIFSSVLAVALGIVLTGCQKKAPEQALMPPTENATDTASDPVVVIGEGQTTGSNQATDTTTTLDVNQGSMPTSAEMAGQTGSFHNVSTKDVQNALKNANLYAGNVDGVLGPKTKKAIKDFQSQNNLTADGKVGPKTWQKLEPFLGQVAQAQPAAAE